MKIFKDRQAAGKLLAQRLGEFRNVGDAIVLGIPRGGVAVAKEVASQLRLPLDIVVTRKIGAPNQPELALGAVGPDGEVFWEEGLLSELGIGPEQLKLGVLRELEEIKRREKEYRHARPGHVKLVRGKTVILVDDGIATGATMLSAIRYLKRHMAKKIILAVPVASKEAVDRVVRELGSASRRIGEVVVLETPEYFQAVGQFYNEFNPVLDEEVVKLLT